ncbi:MAG: class I lanthipeptide, partial [Dinghuibacter sp.]|nr:class I lanthipeptide [Dinghuibacter sp.]
KNTTMKKNNLRKLKLNKKTVVSLNESHARQVNAGVGATTKCPTAGRTCTQTCPSNTAIC